MAKDALRAAGVEVVSFEVPRPHDVMRLYYGSQLCVLAAVARALMGGGTGIMGSDAMQGMRAGLRGCARRVCTLAPLTSSPPSVRH